MFEQSGERHGRSGIKYFLAKSARRQIQAGLLRRRLQPAVPARERQAAAQGEFQVGGVVRGEAVLRGEVEKPIRRGRIVVDFQTEGGRLSAQPRQRLQARAAAAATV